jgi:hypothetical protein
LTGGKPRGFLFENIDLRLQVNATEETGAPCDTRRSGRLSFFPEVMPMLKYGVGGPGGGSIPEYVMRTGTLAPFNPMHVRQDINERSVEDMTHIPVGHEPGVAAGFGTPFGADVAGRPRRLFIVGGSATAFEATRLAQRLKEVAARFKSLGMPSVADMERLGFRRLFGGPVTSLARGEAILLRWRNGTAVTAAL